MDDKKKLSDITTSLGIAAAVLVLIVGLTGIGKDNIIAMTMILGVTVAHIVSFYNDVKRRGE